MSRILVGRSCLNASDLYILYSLALKYVVYSALFIFSFISVIVFAIVIHSVFVFQTPQVCRKLMYYPIINFFQYVSVLIFLTLLIDFLKPDRQIAPLVYVIALTSLTFLFNRWPLSTKKN